MSIKETTHYACSINIRANGIPNCNGQVLSIPQTPAAFIERINKKNTFPGWVSHEWYIRPVSVFTYCNGDHDLGANLDLKYNAPYAYTDEDGDIVFNETHPLYEQFPPTK